MKLLLLALACVLGSLPRLAAETTLRLHGSTTVKAAFEPHRSEVEAKAGVHLELHAFGSASGLLALANGDADMAMISSSLEDTVHTAQKKSATLDPSNFRAAPIGTVRLAFIINPRNPARQLSAAQLAGIFSGKITNWREVGGPDLPIIVVNLANAGSLVEDRLLQGGSITNRAHQVATAEQIPAVVAQEPGAIGIISTAHARGKTSLITSDADISAPLAFVTRGEPDAAKQRVIEAARAALAERG